MKKLLFLIALAALAYTFQDNIGQALKDLSPGSISGRSSDVPPSALEATLSLIRKGGPFPFSRDGVVFENREKRLPAMSRGYYREYTVPTPGSSNRGARRVVTGGNPPEVFYYTEDHYRSFREIGGK